MVVSRDEKNLYEGGSICDRFRGCVGFGRQ